MLTSAQLAFAGVVAVSTLAFIVVGAVLGRVTIGRTELHEANGPLSSRVPQLVIVGPVMVLGVLALLWLAQVSLLALAVGLLVTFMAARVLDSRQPHSAELRERRLRLSDAMARHPASIWGLRALFLLYVGSLVVAELVINPKL